MEAVYEWDGQIRAVAPCEKWRALVLVTDAFGGHGGISRFNRDFLTALCSHPACGEVVSYPRVVTSQVREPLPKRLRFDSRAAGSKVRYTGVVLRDVLWDRSYQFIVCGHINLLPLGVVLSKITGLPVVLVIYGTDAWVPTRSRLVNALAKRVSRVIAISEVTAERFSSWSHIDRANIRLLPCCVDLSRFHPGKKPPHLVERYGLQGKAVLLTLGRLASKEKKGFDEVIEVLPRLRDQIPHVAYVIAGEGPDRARLEQKARSLGVGDRVIFTGMVLDSEKADHYRLADVFVLPSRGEGFGIVLLEAMACGIPVVASKVDGGREALRNGLLGTLVDPGDPGDIEHGILGAFRKSRSVPAGLTYFSEDNYLSRVHGIVGSLLQGQ